MTTTTVFSDTSDGRIASQSTSYTTARAGGTLTAVTAGANFPVGQSSDFAGGVDNYEVNEGFVRFDTSSIPDTDTISAAELSLSLNFDQSTTDFTVEARVSDWGTTLTTADWVAGASLSGLTRVGTLASSGIGSTGAYKAFTEDGTNLRTAINVTGDTRLLLCSSRHVAGTSPASGVSETLYFDSADAAGTTKDPKLVITHAAALTAIGKAVE